MASGVLHSNGNHEIVHLGRLELRPSGRSAKRVLLADPIDPHTPNSFLAIDPNSGLLLYPDQQGLISWYSTQDQAIRRRARSSRPMALQELGAVDGGEIAHLLMSNSSPVTQIPVISQPGIDGVLSSRELDLPEDIQALAISSNEAGELHVLVAPVDDLPAERDPGTLPLILRYDEDGQLTKSWTAEDLQVPHPDPDQLPAVLASSPQSFAFISQRDGRLIVAKFDRDGRRQFELIAGPAGSEYLPPDPALRDVVIEGTHLDALRFATSSAGKIGILDRYKGFFEIDSGGRILDRWMPQAHTLEVDYLGEDLVTSNLVRDFYLYPAARMSENVRPEVYEHDHGTHGGRIASTLKPENSIFVAAPRIKSVIGIDPEHKTVVSTISPAAHGLTRRGLWPSDISSNGDDVLFTASTGERSIERWSTLGVSPTLIAEFPVGLLQGPWRIASGMLSNGDEGVALLTVDNHVEVRDASDGRLIGRFEPRIEMPPGPAPGQGIPVLIFPDEIALDHMGRVLLAESDNKQVHVFAPNGPPPTPTPTPSPNPAHTPTATPIHRCTISGDKYLSGPEEIVLGETSEIELTLHADCPPNISTVGADIVMLIDRSSSMGGMNFIGVRLAVQSLLQYVDTRYHRVAIASFADKPQIHHPLTFHTDALYDVLDGIQQSGSTDAVSGITLANEHLLEQGRDSALPIIIFLSDGAFRTSPALEAAEVRGRGVQVFAIAYGGGVDEDAMLEVAGTSDRYFHAPGPSQPHRYLPLNNPRSPVCGDR